MTQEQSSPKPTPAELNRQLKQQFSLLPRQSRDDLLYNPEETSSRMVARRDNAFAQRMVDNVRALVTEAPVTSSFRSRIIENFGTYQSIGIDPEQEEDIVTKDFSFFEGEDPEDGGIFDPAKAKGLERTAFFRQVGMDLISDQVGQRLRESFKGEEDNPIVRAHKEREDRDRQIRERWKVEFWELYGEQIAPL